jgi:hypothetical protein
LWLRVMLFLFTVDRLVTGGRTWLPGPRLCFFVIDTQPEAVGLRRGGTPLRRVLPRPVDPTESRSCPFPSSPETVPSSRIYPRKNEK